MDYEEDTSGGFCEITDEAALKTFLVYAGYFHDGVISTISYVSGSKCVGSGTHVIDNLRQVTVRIEGLWNRTNIRGYTVELLFENTLKMVVIPTPPVLTSFIFSANILYQGGKFIFLKDVDSVNEDIDPDSYDGTYIISERLKYKIIK